MNIFHVYKKYKAAYKNSVSVMWNVYRKKQFVPIVLKNYSKRIWQAEWVWDYANILSSFPEKGEEIREFYDSIQKTNYPGKDENDDPIEFKFKDYQCKFYGVANAGKTVNGDIAGVFFKEDYRFLILENSTIIDIGANIGDTAIYFALNGATKVIALEPYPNSYNDALRNIKINDLIDKIVLLNAGYGKDSEVNVKEKKANGSDPLEISDSGKEIKIYSLKSLLKEFKLDNNDNLHLKMDCEGCEYNLLNEDDNTLRKFKKIEIEFHYGYRNLESKLKEAGFSVRHSNLIKSSGSELSLREKALRNRDLTFGLIWATRC